jgi:hypothetical protein
VNLHVLATALFLPWIGGCTEGRITSARFVDSVSGVQLEYTLKGAHAYLAEYHRTLRATFADTQVDFPMEMDTGGFLMLNIHRMPDGRLMLFDGAAHILIDPTRRTVVQTNPPLDAAAAEYIGSFDRAESDDLRLVPASERPEKKPLLDHTQ